MENMFIGVMLSNDIVAFSNGERGEFNHNEFHKELDTLIHSEEDAIKHILHFEESILYVPNDIAEEIAENQCDISYMFDLDGEWVMHIKDVGWMNLKNAVLHTLINRQLEV